MKHRPSLMQFQERLYSHLDNRANAVIELVNALSGNTHARSAVELSLSSLFGRHYSDLYKAIDAFALEEKVQWGLMAPFLPRSKKRSFWLLGVERGSPSSALRRNSRGSHLCLSAPAGHQQQTDHHRARLLDFSAADGEAAR